MKKCLVCNNPIEPFMSFGKMPIANGFLSQDKFQNEYFFEMEVASCPICGMFQLVNQPNREMMFNENYAFYSGTSRLMGEHFKSLAEKIKKNFLIGKNPFIVEIGSNDGITLKHFALNKIKHLGIEPSKNVAEVAMSNGVKTIVDFFDSGLAEKIVSEYGQADVFLGANVMCHIPYIKSIVEGIKILLKEDGVVIFEDPYLGDVIDNTTYDQIYDEHTFLFSVHSIRYLFEMYDMEIFDVEPQNTHGGSMRYYIANKGKKKISNNVIKQIEIEVVNGLDNLKTFNEFKIACEKSKENLINIIDNIRQSGKNIVGYAATSKSTTIINFCGISDKHLDYICDTTPIKHWKFSPGAHIPIKPYENFLNNYPDYALLFGYNHFTEIMAKETEYVKRGGKWITYVPEVKII